MNTFKLMISAHDSVLYNGAAAYCGITTPEGSLGLKARHEPILGILKENSLLMYRDASGAEKSIQVAGGMLSFNKNRCIVVVTPH